MEFLENKNGEIAAGAYLLSIAIFVNSVQPIGTGALLIANNDVLGPIWENDCIYLFDSHSEDEKSNLSSSGTEVLLKFDLLYSLGNYIRSVYYNTYPPMYYFQVQFIKVHCTVNAIEWH